MKSVRMLRGQAALPFIAFLGLIVILIGATLNLGQVALVRTETSNAADAGALAGASWMASGNNEAALIAQKMWTGIALAQAIYTVPFCDRPQALSYARLVINNLDTFNQYLRVVANDRILVGAWNLGRREMFTASANNLMIRYRTGAGLLGYIDDAAAMDPQMNGLEDQMKSTALLWERDYNHLVSPLTWDNGMHGPGGQQHTVRVCADGGTCGGQYPGTPARLETTLWSGTSQGTGMTGFGRVWTPCQNIGSPGHPYFPCCHANVSIGWRSGPTTPSNAALGVRFRRDPTNPNVRLGGRVGTSGRKLWDVDLTEVIPNPGQAVIGSCGNVCSTQSLSERNPGTFQPRNIAPSQIAGSHGFVEVQVRHQVDQWAGSTPAEPWNIPLPPGYEWPTELNQWNPLLQPMASSATAEYTAPNVGQYHTDAEASVQSEARLIGRQ